MSDAQPAARPVRPPLPKWTLTVIEAFDVTPHMRRIVFTGEELDTMEWRPAQDLVLMIADETGQPGRRHYTIRRLDLEGRRLAIDFVLHGHGGPAERWALAATPGVSVEAFGPRGSTVLNPAADWHLFVGDETCLPGISAMVEALPAGARAHVILEIAEAADQQPVSTEADVEVLWLPRNGPAAPSSPALIAAVADFEFPAGRGHAYVIGETSTVRAQRQGLLARGLEKSQISAEGYWRPDRRGGHDHIRDEAPSL